MSEQEVESLKQEIERLRQENQVLWDMVDDFNTAVQKAAARLP